MNLGQRYPATIVWLILVSLTMTSWWLGTEREVQASGPQMAVTMGVIILAFIKVRLILFQFMEVRSAPRLLRGICDGWVIGMCVLLLTLIGSLQGR